MLQTKIRPQKTPYKLTLVKSSGKYRLKFEEDFLARLLAQDAEAFSLAFAKLKLDLETLGRIIFLDSDDTDRFNISVGANEAGFWTSRFEGLPIAKFRIMRAFSDGYMNLHFSSFEESFELAAEFNSMIGS